MNVPYTIEASLCFCEGEALVISRLMAKRKTSRQIGTVSRMQQGECFVSNREMQVMFQCPCRRSTISSSLPAGGMHYDFLQFPSRRNSNDFQQSPCRGDARRFPQFPSCFRSPTSRLIILNVSKLIFDGFLKNRENHVKKPRRFGLPLNRLRIVNLES